MAKAPKVQFMSWTPKIGLIEVAVGKAEYEQIGMGENVMRQLTFLIRRKWFGKTLSMMRKWRFYRNGKCLPKRPVLPGTGML